tara:strand:+ start:1188 stop:1361 length:174 start_codon:yes stop_codon:yes gene_type:complete
MSQVTKEQFKAYKKVQNSGRYNMFTPDAMLATGLDKTTYFEIIDKYSKYKEQFEEGE